MERCRSWIERLARGTLFALVLLAPMTAVAAPAGGAPNLGGAKRSVVQGLPVPAQAKLVFRRTTSVDYLVLGPLQVIDAWYWGRLPENRSWRSWAVCDPGHLARALFPAKGFHRLWVRGEDALELATFEQHTDLDQVRILVNQFRFESGGPGIPAALLCRPQRR